jgi:hypothetical protein
MPAVILDFTAHLQGRKDRLAKPSIPTDLFAEPDGSWGCSTDTMINLMRWFELYGYEFDPTCLFEDMASDLCAILRASSLLDHIHQLPSGSPYFQYLHTVRKGNAAETKIALARLRKVSILQVQ